MSRNDRQRPNANPNSDIETAKRAEGTDKAPDAGTGQPDTSVPGDTAPTGSEGGTGNTNKAPAMGDDVSDETPAAANTEGQNEPTEERPNNALTTLDDVSVTLGREENTDRAEANAASTTPSKVLEAVYEPAPVVQSQEQADPEAAPLVVSPSLGTALAEADARAALPTPDIAGARVLPDIGAGAADSANRTVVVSAEAKPKATGDGKNAGATDATGYVAPIRVSAAGVPSTDPTVLAQTAGDLGTINEKTDTRGPGTSDRPDTNTPSTGLDGTRLSSEARIGGNAQHRNPAFIAGQTTPLSANESARVNAAVAARTGAPLPPSVGDATMTSPTPAGDKETANRVASASVEDQEPEPLNVPGAKTAEKPKANPGEAKAEAVEAANAQTGPGDLKADPYTARPIDGESPTPVGLGGEARPEVRDAADKAQRD